MTARCALAYMGALKFFGSPCMTTPTANFPDIRFGDIAGFLRSQVTPPIFNPNFGGVPVAPDGPCWGQPGSRGLKLFGREIIFEEFQPM